ncbi:MAG TPA: sulfatase [Actinomycetota bacterium]
MVVPTALVAAALTAVGAGVGTGCPGLFDRSALPRGTAAPGAPNVLLIISDDQRADTLWGMPNVRRLLGGHGITFTHFYVTTPVCCPARAGFLTGQVSSHTGVLDNVGPQGGAAAFDDRSTVATWLTDAGYTTGLFGKYLNGYPDLDRCGIPPGWARWHAVDAEPQSRYYDYLMNDEGHIHSYGEDPADYQTDVITRKVDSFVRNAPEPFFAYVTPSNPHRPAQGAPQDEEDYANLPPFMPPSFDEADVSDKPWGDRVPPMSPDAVDTAQKIRRHMMESLKSMDRDVGRMVSALRDRGVLDRTIVIFTSDNGFLWGEHRLQSKTWPYEESIRVPMVVRVPWIDHAVVEPRLVTNVDIAPTLTQLAGTQPGLPQDGRSIVPLLRRGNVHWRTEFLFEWEGRNVVGAAGPLRYLGLHTDRYVYIEYSSTKHELYDLRRDPYELENLAGRPETVLLQYRLGVRLHRRFDAMCALAPCTFPRD